MNWRPMVTTDGKTWAGNALVFATKEEAEDSARELMMRWMAVRETRADEVDLPVNYRFVDGKNERIV
jgi:hypothetical protein